MYYGREVILMLTQGKSHEEIIQYFDKPFINEQYVKYADSVLNKKNFRGFKIDRRAPKKGTKIHIVHEHRQKIGLNKFLKEYEELGPAQIARNIGTTDTAVRMYKWDYIDRKRRAPTFYDGCASYSQFLYKQQLAEEREHQAKVKKLAKLF